ncbi:hypothetical protein ACFS07_10440 [Undibacterium arcticum]
MRETLSFLILVLHRVEIESFAPSISEKMMHQPVRVMSSSPNATSNGTPFSDEP